MKEPSGIYKSNVDDSIFVVFGGKIALTIDNDNEHQYLVMFELKDQTNIGSEVDSSMINSDCPPVALAFNDVSSINLIIKTLERIKHNLIKENK